MIGNQTDDYFIGSMVVYKKQKQQYGVVDGQQRLTTITILLCVLRDTFQALGEVDLARGIHQLVEKKDRLNKNEFVLKTETSFPYFQEHIQKYDGDPEIDSEIRSEEKNLANAHARFKSLITAILQSVDSDASVAKINRKKVKLEKLTSIRDTVLNLSVIFITLDNEDDAYIIFETLNTRGKDLALADLVKNHFTKHLKSKGDVDHARLKWDALLETIHNSSADILMDNFIYHFWASRYEAIPQKKLFPKIKNSITKTTARDYLNYLVSDSKLYRSLHEVTYGWDKNESSISKSLGAMQLFKLSQPVPATLSLARAYKDKVIKLPKLRDALRAIEKFHFQFTAITSSRSSGGISAMYSSFAQKLYEASTPQIASDEIGKLTDKLRERVPSFDEFNVAFKEVNYTNANSKQKHLVKYILRKFSEHYKYKFPVDFDELTVEHLHPQSKIAGQWTAEIVGSLGNLIYLDSEKNGEIDRKGFEEKRSALLSSGCALPAFVSCAKSWSAEEITKHTEEMAQVAYNEIWKI